jgi:hypothetical protein
VHCWNAKATRILKDTLASHPMPRKELVRRLKAVGVNDSQAAIASKLSRGKFSFAFLLQIMAAIDVGHLDIDQFEPSEASSGASHGIVKMDESRIAICRKGGVACTLSHRDGTVEIELGPFLKKKPGAAERLVKVMKQAAESFVDRELAGDL